MSSTANGNDGDAVYYEYIVLGLGGVGSAAVYRLAKQVGSRVLGLEQFRVGHDNGGSQDHSRLIRSFQEDEQYARLVHAMFEAWREVEEESGVQVYYRTGGLAICWKGSPREKSIMDEYQRNLGVTNASCEFLNSEELMKRFPQYDVTPDMFAFYDRDGGILDAATSNAVHVQLARAHGATILDECPVTELAPTSDGGVQVTTPRGVFRCRRLVVTAGAWTNDLLGHVGVNVPLEVTQEQVTYSATTYLKDFTKDRFPYFSFVTDKHYIYGTPIHGMAAVKVGIDCGGNVTTAKSRTFTPDPIRERICMQYLKRYLPKAVGPIQETKTCLYTLTKDRNFVLDTLESRGMPQIIVFIGAGHAYKFVALLGKILADMAVSGRCRHDVTGFSITRPAVTDPTFRRTFHVGIDAKL